MAVYRFDIQAQRISDANLPAATGAMPDLLSDTLYVADGTAVKGVLSGATTPGTWRSRRYQFPAPISFGWGKLEGTVVAGAVVRLYTDGVLTYTTPTITSRDPFRLPARRAKRWELEVESTDRITGLRLGQSVEELRNT